jgi:short-subunit dehydrogenase
MRGLRRQTALITAASMGIGAVIAAALADQRLIVS